MPLKLYPPDRKHATYRVRGTHLRIRVDRSTGTRKKTFAEKLLRQWTREIEDGAYESAERGGAAEPASPLSFAAAALSYMQAGGEGQFLPPLIAHFALKPAGEITQADADAAAAMLCPGLTEASKNRKVYTPVSAVLHHAGFETLLVEGDKRQTMKRPKGARGRSRLHWLRPDEAARLIAAARARAERLELEIEPAVAAASPRTRAIIRRAAIARAKAARRFTAYIIFLLFTGCRMEEALRIRPADAELQRSFVFCGTTKNGEPRPVHLPPQVVAELANIEFGRLTLFGFTGKSGRLYIWLKEVAEAAGVTIPPRVAFHLFRHTYGAWMRRYGGLDTSGLVATGAWRSHEAARIYEHVETSEEAQKADRLPRVDLGETWEKPASKAKN